MESILLRSIGPPESNGSPMCPCYRPLLDSAVLRPPHFVCHWFVLGSRGQYWDPWFKVLTCVFLVAGHPLEVGLYPMNPHAQRRYAIDGSELPEPGLLLRFGE